MNKIKNLREKDRETSSNSESPSKLYLASQLNLQPKLIKKSTYVYFLIFKFNVCVCAYMHTEYGKPRLMQQQQQQNT